MERVLKFSLALKCEHKNAAKKIGWVSMLRPGFLDPQRIHGSASRQQIDDRSRPPPIVAPYRFR